MIELWDSLRARETGAKAPPAILGYRGCVLRHEDGTEFTAFDGVVTRKINQKSESRVDVDRRFEKRLLSSATAELLRGLPVPL